MKKELVNHLTWLVNGLAPFLIHEKWSTESGINDTKNIFRAFYESIKLNELIDWNNLDEMTAKELRFGKWATDEDIDTKIKRIRASSDVDEEKERKIQLAENTRRLFLIPAWLFPLIPEGMELISISGDRIINDGQLDSRVRFGCVTYGIHIN